MEAEVLFFKISYYSTLSKIKVERTGTLTSALPLIKSAKSSPTILLSRAIGRQPPSGIHTFTSFNWPLKITTNS